MSLEDLLGLGAAEDAPEGWRDPVTADERDSNDAWLRAQQPPHWA